MWYILLAILSWIVLLILADKKRIKEYIPAFLLSSVIGYSLDAVFDVTLKSYFYYDPPLPNGILIMIMELFIGPVYGVLFIQYLPTNKNKYLPYIAGWTIFLLLFEAVYHETGLLLYYRWNYFYSTLTYLFTLILLIWQHHYLLGRSK